MSKAELKEAGKGKNKSVSQCLWPKNILLFVLLIQITFLHLLRMVTTSPAYRFLNDAAANFLALLVCCN